MEIAPDQRLPVVPDQITAGRLNEPALVESLVRVVEYVADNHTGGGEALARLLLSCYDGGDFPLDVAELGRVDDDFFADALNVIRLRCRAQHEPHTFFVDGGRLFNQIEADFGIERKSDQVPS